MGLGNIGGYIDENWHGGQIDGDYFEHPEMPLEENAKGQSASKGQVWNWEHAMTRELMRGRHKPEILAKYKTVLDRFGIRKEASEFLDRNDGVLGWFIVDVSNFDDKFGYEDIPDEMRVCNLYALNATELREVISRSLISENDGTLDGFLGTEDGVSEEISYIDECTGLPCIDGWDGESDDSDDRLAKIADVFLGRKWMSLSEKQGFDGMEGKLPYLVSLVRRHFAPKSTSNGKFDDDVNDFDVKGQDLEADSVKAEKQAEVTGIRESAMDDVGYVAMPEKYDIAEEHRQSDYREDVSVGRKVDSLAVERLRNRKLDDIGDVAPVKSFAVEQVKEKDGIGEIETDVKIDYGKVNDNLSELSDADYSDDFEFDDTVEDFVIDDIDDMKDDDFDYADLDDVEVDEDELMDEVAMKDEVQVEDAPEEVEISNKYDWSW